MCATRSLGINATSLRRLVHVAGHAADTRPAGMRPRRRGAGPPGRNPAVSTSPIPPVASLDCPWVPKHGFLRGHHRRFPSARRKLVRLGASSVLAPRDWLSRAINAPHTRSSPGCGLIMTSRPSAPPVVGSPATREGVGVSPAAAGAIEQAGKRRSSACGPNPGRPRSLGRMREHLLERVVRDAVEPLVSPSVVFGAIAASPRTISEVAR